MTGLVGFQVRHRPDDLEIPCVKPISTCRVRHRPDDLEIEDYVHGSYTHVRHRPDDLETVIVPRVAS